MSSVSTVHAPHFLLPETGSLPKVLGNKKDLPGALTERELIERMDLQTLAQVRPCLLPGGTPCAVRGRFKEVPSELFLSLPDCARTGRCARTACRARTLRTLVSQVAGRCARVQTRRSGTTVHYCAC